MERYVYDRPYSALHRVTPPPPSSGRLSSSQSARPTSVTHDTSSDRVASPRLVSSVNALDSDMLHEGGEETASLRSAATSSAGPSCSSLTGAVVNNVTVVVRVRPPLPRELATSYSAASTCGFRNIVDIGPSHTSTQATTLTLCGASELDVDAAEEEQESMYYNDSGTMLARQSFSYDAVFGPAATQRLVYECAARPAVDAVLEGYNATLIAYGQTGTGKTYTMEGFVSETPTTHQRRHRGIIPRAVEDIFAILQARQEAHPQERFLVRASYAQIYNEVLSDLLATTTTSSSSSETSKPLAVRHSPRRGVYIDGLSEWVVTSAREVYALMVRGAGLRATASTRLSELSSRSHAIFTVVVETLQGAPAHTVAHEEDGEAELNEGCYRVGKLHIVDLAGSEKVRQAGVSGQRLEETKKINKSLHELGNVIAALASMSHAAQRGKPKTVHVPFRNSILTSALRDSLGGNCRTTLIACVSPSAEAYSETLSTLLFASRARCVRNHAVVNERIGGEGSSSSSLLLRRYEKELAALRYELAALHSQQQQQLGVSNGSGAASEVQTALSTATTQCQRAEEDKKAALEALEQTSAAHAEERRRRQALERRVHQLEAMLDANAITPCRPTSDTMQDTITTGSNSDDVQTTAVTDLSRQLATLEQDKATQREDTVQMTRYKQLLLKQRDMMLSLTSRLQERDEVILRLEDELDAYDAELEQKERQIEELQHIHLSVTQPTISSSSSNNTAEAALGGDVHALAELRQALETRAAQIARAQYAERVTALQNESYVMQLRATLAEEQCRVLEAALTSSVSSADIASWMAESRQVQRATLQKMAAEMAAQGDARRALAHEVHKLQLTLSQLRHGDTYSHDELDRLWQALRLIEEGIQPQPTSDTNTLYQYSSDAVMEELRKVQTAMAAQERTWQERFAQLQQEQQQQKARSGPLLSSATTNTPIENDCNGKAGVTNDATLRLLRQQLLVHEKDRQALQLIMEQRMKPKVERICDILQGEHGMSDETAAATVARTALVQEASSLRTLVIAAIRAMSAD